MRIRAFLVTAAFALAACSTPAPAPSPGMDMNSGADMTMPGTGMPPMKMAPMPAAYMGQADKPGAPVFTGLSDHHHPISSKNPQTQKFFDQGVDLMFGFNHAEAIRSFREAARLDPNCAICWWGISVALGPNINMNMPPDAVAPAWQSLKMAQSLEGHASPEERDWIEALASRYSDDPKADRGILDEAYAQAMGKLWRDYPDDLDAGVFYAEAMMDTQPWDYWQADGRTPKGHGGEIVSTLESVIARAPNHPGALHLYIHAVEASTTPERAEAAADRLEPLMPDAGHIVHMPSHIYYRVGRYADAARVNELAAQSDERYIASCKAQGYYPIGYYGHNIHFLWTSSEMMGRYGASIDAARRLVKAIGPDVAKINNIGAQTFYPVPVVTLVRFGKWNAVLAEPAPQKNLKLVVAISHYARGFAFANKGDFKHARWERAKLAAMKGDADLLKLDRGMPASQMTELALDLLEGEIARKSGHLDEAVDDFTKARTIELALPYNEPPNWHQPVSHILGAALLQAHRPAEAEAVYRDSLMRYRMDGWALFGLAQALDAQGKKDEAAAARKQFATAWQLADVKLTSSRF
jgi:tetratricopeptide (TPR) repeat protein